MAASAMLTAGVLAPGELQAKCVAVLIKWPGILSPGPAKKPDKAVMTARLRPQSGHFAFGLRRNPAILALIGKRTAVYLGKMG